MDQPSTSKEEDELSFLNEEQIKLIKEAHPSKESYTLTLKKKITSSELIQAVTLPPLPRIITGCSSIDDITCGGLPINGVNEIYGCSGVGKTQLCLQLAIMTQLQQPLKSCVYITTEDAFPIRRLDELSKIYENNYKLNFNIKDNILLNHCFGLNELNTTIFEHLPKLLQIKPIGLLVIDSIAGIFRCQSFKSRSKNLFRLIIELRKLARIHNFAIVITNQVSDNIDTGKTDPCLGLVWSNLVVNRFLIVKNSVTSEREFHIIFSPDLPPKTCNFIITQSGIQ